MAAGSGELHRGVIAPASTDPQCQIVCYDAVTALTEYFCQNACSCWGRNEDGNGVDHGRHQYPSWTWWFAWYPIMHKGERIWLRWIQRRWHDRWLGDGWHEYRW